ncbi:MAG: hypothetical protein ACOCX8_01945 [Bacteroidota bacterium]
MPVPLHLSAKGESLTSCTGVPGNNASMDLNEAWIELLLTVNTSRMFLL